MNIDISEIKQLLTTIRDPRTGTNIVQAGIVKDVLLEGNDLTIQIYSSNMDSTDKGNLTQAIVFSIQATYPELEVNIQMVNRAPDIQDRPSPLPQVKNIIAVGSGKGGVGKSTISVGLSFALNRLGYKVGLLDADIYGPSIPTMLGLKGKRPPITNVYGKTKLMPIDVNGVQTMSIGNIIEPDQAVVLRGPRLTGIIKQFIEDTVWEELDFMIIDLPPGTGDIQLTLVQTVPLSGAVIVTTPQEVAFADALRAMNMFRMDQINVPIIGVIENMAWFTPRELPDNKYFIFGEGGGERLAKLSHSSILGQVPLIMGLRESGDQGTAYKTDKEGHNLKIFEEVGKNLILQLNKVLALQGRAKIVEIKS